MTDTYRFINVVNYPPAHAGDIVLSDYSKEKAHEVFFGSLREAGRTALKSLGGRVADKVIATGTTKLGFLEHGSHLIEEVQDVRCNQDLPTEFCIGYYDKADTLLEQGVAV